MKSNRDSKGPLSEINIVPLVDVMLVLLIIFMITAPMMQHGMNIDIPVILQQVHEGDLPQGRQGSSLWICRQLHGSDP